MKAEVMSGSARGAKLYQLMSSGEAVPNEIVTDILAEAMIRKAGGSKVWMIIQSFDHKLRRLNNINPNGTSDNALFIV